MASDVTFVDESNESPSANAFNGMPQSVGFSWAWIGGFSISDSHLGSVRQDGGFSGQTGLDASITYGVGTSWVMEYNVIHTSEPNLSEYRNMSC